MKTIRLLEIKANELFIKGWKYSQNRILEDLSTSNCFISKDMLANPVFDGASLFWRGQNFKSWLLTQKSCNLVNFISSDRLACRHENDTSGFSWNLSSASTNQYSPITTLKSLSQSQWTLDPLALVCAQNVSLGKYLLECWKFDTSCDSLSKLDKSCAPGYKTGLIYKLLFTKVFVRGDLQN